MMIEKDSMLDEFDKLERDFTDENGRITFYPSGWKMKYNWKHDSQNQHLWTGQAMLLKLFYLRTYSNFRFINNSIAFSDIISLCCDFPGINVVEPMFITRHPEPYINTPEYDPMSFDEHNGIAYSCLALNDYFWLNEIIRYGDRYAWCFYEKKLYTNPWRNLLYPKTLFPFLKTLFKALKFAIKTKDFTGSNEMDSIIGENETLGLLSRIRLPKDVAFLKIISPDYRPSFLGKLHFFLAALHTIKKPDLSGKNMLWFKLLAFELKGYKPWWVLFIVKKFQGDKINIQNVFVDFYTEKVHKFRHPFINLRRYIDEIRYGI